jgi:hypothetical protein
VSDHGERREDNERSHAGNDDVERDGSGGIYQYPESTHLPEADAPSRRLTDTDGQNAQDADVSDAIESDAAAND